MASSSSSVGWTTIIMDDFQSFLKNPAGTTSSFLNTKLQEQDWIALTVTLLALLVAVSTYYVLLDKRKLTSTLGESLFTTPSFLDSDSGLEVSFGKNWKRRRQTLAMFSCSLSFIMPAVLICHLSFLWGVYWCFSNKQYALGLGTGIYLLYCWFLDMAPTYGDRSPLLRGSRTSTGSTSFLSSWWDNACDYLPLLLVKTADLPAYDDEEEASGKDDGSSKKPVKKRRKKYVLGYHPHGIIAVGAFCAFATDSARVLDLSQNKSKTEQEDEDVDEDWIKAAREAAEEEDDAAAIDEAVQQKAKNVKGLMKGSMKDDDATGEDDDDDDSAIVTPSPSSKKHVPRGFSTLFPQLDRRVVTLPQNFWTPLLREYFLSMGAVTSDRDTFRRYLASQHPGALVVVVGGAAESMVANTGTINLVLEKRRGFVREAIHANASLVPVLGFGETDLYQLYDAKDPVVAKIQTFVKATFGFAMPFFKGRDMFLKKIGVMPQRTPVVVVVGKPIPPPTTLAGNKPHHEFNPKIDRQNDKALNEDGKVLIEWHDKYVKSLNELYQEYKDAKWNMPGQTRSKSLRIVR